jgi:hypothetical protein
MNKTKQIFLTTAVIAGAVGMVTAGVGIEAQAQVDSWSTYQNSTSGFQIQYPSTWIKNDSSAIKHPVSFSAPPFASVNIDAPVLRQHIPVDVFTALALVKAKQEFKNFTPISSNKTTLGGMPAQKVVYEYLHPAGFTVRVMQVVTMNNDRVFFVTCGGLPDEFPADVQIFNKMLDSFRFIPTVNATTGAG